MSTVTTFLGLTKPAGPEQFNLATYNNNLDLVDAYARNTTEKLPKGVIAQLDDTTTSTGLAGTGIMCNLVQADLVAGRWYRVTYTLDTVCPEASMAIACVFNKSVTTDNSANGTNMNVGQGTGYQYYIYTAPGVNLSKTDTWAIRFKATTTETVNVKAIMARATGSNGYSVAKRCLTVEDLGARI